MRILAIGRLVGAILGVANLMASAAPAFAGDLFIFVKVDNEAMRDEFLKQVKKSALGNKCTGIDDPKVFTPVVKETPPKRGNEYDETLTKTKFQLGFKCKPNEKSRWFSSSLIVAQAFNALRHVRNKGDRDGTLTVMIPRGTCYPQDCAGLGYPELRDRNCLSC